MIFFDKESLFYKNVYSYFYKNHPECLKLLKIHPEDFNLSNFNRKFFTIEHIQDLSANPNSNVSNRTIARLKSEIINLMMRYLTFETLYEKMVKMYGIHESYSLMERLLNGSLYLHDSSAGIVPYCLGVDFQRIITEGMPYGQLYSLPPKKPKTFINQVKEAIIELSSEFAGAIAFPTLLILYTYVYLKTYGKDCEINIKEIKDDFQNLVHTINKEMRNGVESPFTNISYFDKYILDELLSFVYPHFISELGIDKDVFIEKIMEIQKVVMEFLCAGDPVTMAPYRFPVQTVNMLINDNNEILDKEFFEFVCKNNTRGQMNIYVSKDARKYSMCCRFQPEYDSLKFDSFGNGGINVGSIRVVTINLNRIALRTKEFVTDFIEENLNSLSVFCTLLEIEMEKAKKILDAFRECIRERIDKKVYRYFNLNWFDLDKHFYSTIGFIGLYEAINTLELTDEFEETAIEILEIMDRKIKEFNDENRTKGKKFRYNLEQVPGESLACLFPQFDKYFYGEENVPYVIYANQFVPLYVQHSILDKIRIEGKFFKYLSGGGISHINILHELTPEEVKILIEMCIEAGIEHFALNPVYSICKNNHHLLGKFEKCYICDSPIVDYLTRVVGFFTKVSSWSKARREWEFQRRIWNGFLKQLKKEIS